MAHVKITLDDIGGGKVRVEMTPSFADSMKSVVRGDEITSATAYAIHALRMIQAESRKNGPSKILIPRLRV